MSELREGARVRFKDAQAAAVYGMPADAEGVVKGWCMYFGKRWVVKFDGRAKLNTTWVKPDHLKVVTP